MSFIQTKSFKLAVYLKGDVNSSKFALVLPGQLDTKDYPHMRSHVEYLANRGYLALSFDPAGTWESPGNFRLYTMTNYLKQIYELIEHFDNKPTFLIGHSRGGSMAMLAGTRNPHVNMFGAIMSYYSFGPSVFIRKPSVETKKLGYKKSKRDLPGNPSQFREFKLPYEFFEDQIQYDLSKGLVKCTKPKMFVVGEKDVLVDPSLVRASYAMAANPKKLYALDSGHDYRRESALIEKVNGFIEEFLDTHQV